MTRSEFELMIEPIRLSSLDLMPTPSIEAFTEALKEVRRREGAKGDRAKVIREHLKELRESQQHDPANFYHGRQAFMYVAQGAGRAGPTQFILRPGDTFEIVEDGNTVYSEEIRYEQSTHGDEAGAQSSQGDKP